VTSIYHDEKKVVFIHVHKCAGTAIFHSLLCMNFDKSYEQLFGDTPPFNTVLESGSQAPVEFVDDTTALKQKAESTSGWKAIPNNAGSHQLMAQNSELLLGNIQNPVHFRAIDMRDYLGSKNYHSYNSIACVRNPWKRLFSWYRFLKKDKRNPGHHALVKNWELEEFIQFSIDHFYHPQSDWLVDETGEVIVDNIVKHEDLHAEWPVFTEKYLGKKLELPVTNKSKHKASFSEFSCVRKSTLERFREKYAKDFELLGYDSSLPPHRESCETFSHYEMLLENDNETGSSFTSNNLNSGQSDECYELFRLYNSTQHYVTYLQHKLDEKTHQCSHYKRQTERQKNRIESQRELVGKLKSKMQRMSSIKRKAS